MREWLFRLLAALVLVAIAACNDQSSPSVELTTLRVGVLPDQSADALRERYAPLLTHLSDELGRPCDLVIPGSYEELERIFQSGEIDIAYLGGLTFVRAERAGRAIPLVMRDVDTRFTTYFLVRADDPAADLADFAGKTLAFGSRLSTSGHLMPRTFLDEREIEPESFFAEVLYSGAHDKTAINVRDGVADLGAANAHIIDTMYADGRLARNEVRILWETPPYAGYVWAVRPELSVEARQKIRDAFLSLSPTEPAHVHILDRLRAGAFLPVIPADFEPLTSVAEDLELLGDTG